MYKTMLLILALLVLLPACKKPRRPPGPQEPLDLKPEQVSYDLQGLGSRLRGEVVPLALGDPDTPPFMDGEPEHLRFAFDNDHLATQVDPRERQILIYPVVSFTGLFYGVERMEFEKRVRTLAGRIKDRPPSVTESIPLFPATDTPQLFHSQIRYLEFTGGAGIRFIGSQAHGLDARTGDSLFYAFQGLTRDGKYLVCFYYPVAGGAFPPVAQPSEAAHLLDSHNEPDFTPDLARLDGMARSIRIISAHP
jgi:hypothetical protein